MPGCEDSFHGAPGAGGAPDPDRGYALAALTGALELPNAKPALLREFGAQLLGETLFTLSYDYVGDLAETLALIWEPAEDVGPGHNRPPPSLSDVVRTLQLASKRETPQLLRRWLDGLDATGRWALLKLVTGGLRVGVSARLAKQAVDLKPEDGNYRKTLGVALYRAERWKEAIAALEKSMELRKGGDSLDWFFLAMAHRQLDEKDKARELYERAAEWMDKNQPRNEELRRFRVEAEELMKKESGVRKKPN